jgi:hypothetical protein
MESQSQSEQAESLRQVGLIAAETQNELDELSVPPDMVAFVVADRARREYRIVAGDHFADIVQAGGFDSAEALAFDALGNELNAMSEGQEDANGLAHCP